MKRPYIFGIRHLSPAGAWHLRNFLREKNPKLVLVEGPCDFDDTLVWLSDHAVAAGAGRTTILKRLFSAADISFTPLSLVFAVAITENPFFGPHPDHTEIYRA